MSKLACKIRNNDKLMWRGHKWLVLEHTDEKPKLGAPIVRLKLRDLKSQQVDTFTFAYDQELPVY